MSMGEPEQSFLSRWSRRKTQVRQDGEPPVVQVLPPVAPGPADRTPVAAPAAEPVPALPAAETPPAVPKPTLDDVHALTGESDFSRFVARDVDPEVKNLAMKKLFADPHYNVMDGLDTYIDDYGRADPIPKSMLRQMVQARMLGLLDDEMEEQPVPAGVVTSGDLEPAGGVDPTPSPPQAGDRPGSAPEALQIELAHDGAALQEPSKPPTERAAGQPEVPAA